MTTPASVDTAPHLRSRHLLGVTDLEADEIRLILNTAEAMQEIASRPIKKVPTLRGRTVVNLFFEPSTRTRTSFEVAEKRLSADTLSIAVATSSVSKGESLLDTVRNIEAMSPDMIVMRHSSAGAPHLLARMCRSVIINAGDGMHEHPTQALLDAFTIREHKKRIEGLKIAIVGDLLHSRVLRSNIQLLNKLGAHVWACGPSTLMPPELPRFGVRPTTSLDEAVDGADVVMMLRIQHERMQGHFIPSTREYFFAVRAHTRTAEARGAGRHHPASRTDEPRRRDRFRCRRRPVFGHPGAGGQRRRGQDGGPVSARRSRRRGSLMTLLLKGGRLIDPATNRDGELDLLVQDGKIARIGKNLPADGAEVVALKSGWIVAPGLIDIHVHLREPGQEHKETVATGAASAVAGGFTAVACMPNTDPINDHPGITELILRKAAQANLARVYPIGAVSIGSKGEQLAELGAQKAAGCVAFTDDGRPVASALLMRRALEYAGMLGVPIIDHCEDPSLKGDGVAHEGFRAASLGLRGIPGAAESIMVERDIALAELTGGAFHVAHMSARQSLRAVRAAKMRGLRVTSEVAPHHFVLTDESLEDPIRYDTNTKMNPPLQRGGGSRRDARRAGRRHRRRHRHGSRSASRGRKARRVRPRAVWYRRSGNRDPARLRSARAQRPD